MSLIIDHQDQTWKFEPLPSGAVTWSARIDLPARITMTFDGKNTNDTEVDQAGNILQDMSVMIDNVRLDGLSCWTYWPELSIVLEKQDSDEILLGRNITANGRVDLWLQEANALFWLIKTKLA